MILAAVACISTIILAFTEQSAADVVAANHQLEDKLGLSQDELAGCREQGDVWSGDVDWLLALYNTSRGARFLAAAMVEQGLSGKDEVKYATLQIIELYIAQQNKLIGNHLDNWNLSVYLPDEDATTLYCSVCRRSNQLEESSPHRSWPAGVGHVGKAFAEKREVVIDDMQKPEYKTFIMTPDELRKSDDHTKYRSMVSVPIRLKEDGVPSGVLIATSDVKNRFYNKEDSNDVSVKDPVEPLRSLAGILALLHSVKITVNDHGA